VGLLGGARSRSIGTEGAEALPRWDPPASCPRWLSNTTCGEPSSRWARGTARMRVPSSSLILRSEAPVRTRRGSGFEPLISRAVRGSVWAAPSFAFAAIEGSGRASPRSAGWQHSVAWVLVAPALLQVGAGRPSHTHALFFRELISCRVRGSCRSRVLRGMGARGASFTSSRPRATFSRRCPIEGYLRLESGVRPARGSSLLGKGAGH
jgi:hypothetical protein